MENFLLTFQNLPSLVNPIAFKIGFFSVAWYPLMYLIAFLFVYFLLLYRTKKDTLPQGFTRSMVLDFLIYAFWGVIIGARIGYVFYDWNYFWQNPMFIFSPYDFQNHMWIGIYGMSYHGGLLGAFLGVFVFAKKNKIEASSLINFVIPTIPAGYFFGRMGNFLNLELFGKPTQLFWGMNFGDGILRYPTQLYEALGEGLILFIIFWSFKNKSIFKKYGLSIYLIGYGLFRIVIDFLREPDGIYQNIGGLLAWSQIFSLIMILLGLGSLALISKKKMLK